MYIQINNQIQYMKRNITIIRLLILICLSSQINPIRLYSNKMKSLTKSQDISQSKKNLLENIPFDNSFENILLQSKSLLEDILSNKELKNLGST